MVRTMPRDIDDLYVITHCQDELHAPFGDFQGPFGFGRYENGQSRGNYCDPDPAKITSPSFSALAAARRSHDPGAIELNARIPIPSSIDAVLRTPKVAGDQAQPARQKAAQDSGDGNMLSHLPFHWGKWNDVCAYTADEQVEPSVEETSQNRRICSSTEWCKLTESRRKAKARIDLATSCMRRWVISMKVGGVSSRTTLFPSCNVIDIRKNDGRKMMRPMLCLARLPQSTQSGQTVTVEMAAEMDNAGLAHLLGSYDCRFADNLANKNSSNRAKRIEIGRTRLVWSNLIQGDAAQNNRRVSYNSLITGLKIDTQKFKRPTEVKVGVRLSGRIVMEETLDDPIATISNLRKRKHLTRQTETEYQAPMPSVKCPDLRTSEEIDAAINNTSFRWSRESSLLVENEVKAVVYEEAGAQAHSNSDIDRNDIIAGLLKASQKKSGQKKAKRSVSDSVMTEAANTTAGGIQVTMKYKPPRIACIPLEDGLIRTLCLNTGNMCGKSVNQVLGSFAKEASKRMCSICWSDEGSGKEGVQECTKCGLLAHSACCFDKGDFVTALKHSNSNTHFDASRANDYDLQWDCSICCHYTEAKPRRNARMPSRFVDGETYTSSTHAIGNCSSFVNANMLGPECSLCPHRGGAMSPLGPLKGSDHLPTKWVHEVCRIWSGLNLSNVLNTKQSSSLMFQSTLGTHLLNVCALCGKGGGIDERSSSACLTKCAARGCLVAFHPMCALLTSKSKVGEVENNTRVKSVRTRLTRRNGQCVGDIKTDEKDIVEADKNLCNEYTLDLVHLTRANAAGEGDTKSIIPVAFCGIHNPRRDASSYGCIPF